MPLYSQGIIGIELDGHGGSSIFDFPVLVGGATKVMMSNNPKEWFRLLDLNLGASLDEVKCSYRELAKVWHPDRFAHDPSLLRKSQEKMKELNFAYQQICVALAKDPNAFTFHTPTSPRNSVRRANRQSWTAPSTVPERAYPSPPMAIVCKGDNAAVRLTWTPVHGYSSYNVKRSTVSGGPYRVIANGVAWTEYLDASAVNGTRYYYVVSSIDGSTESPNSPEFTAQPLALPAAPGNLTARVIDDGHSVELNWHQSSSPELRWNLVYRATIDDAFLQIAQVSTAIRYVDLNYPSGVACRYVVTAVNSNAQQSPFSNVAATSLK